MWLVTNQWQSRGIVCLGATITAKVKETRKERGGESEGERGREREGEKEREKEKYKAQ